MGRSGKRNKGKQKLLGIKRRGVWIKRRNSTYDVCVKVGEKKEGGMLNHGRAVSECLMYNFHYRAI